jgi:hypothetical protein
MKDYNQIKKETSLLLSGATAEAAVDCMRQEGVMPLQPAGTNPQVEVNDAKGRVEIREDGKKSFGKWVADSLYGDPAAPPPILTTVMQGENAGTPAYAKTSEVSAEGPAANKMQQKARTCAFKSAGISP